MKHALGLVFLFCAAAIGAQDLPTPIVDNPFAKPGIRNASPGKALSITYERQPNYKLMSGQADAQDKGDNEVEAKERFEAKIKFPLVLRGHWKVLGDMYYSFERYDFDELRQEDYFAFQAIDGTALKRTRLTLFGFRSMSPKHYIALRGEVSANGDYGGFIDLNKKFMVYRVAGVFGIKKNEDTELGFGVMANNSFRRSAVYPFMLYNHNFNDKWGLETVLPIKATLRRNLSEKSILSFAAEYWSSAYALDLEPPNAPAPVGYIFKSAAAQFFVEWEKNFLNTWTWVSFRGGYSYNFDSRFVLNGTRTGGQIDAYPSNSVFVSVSLFLAPPKKFMEANTRTAK